ncbi:MAG: carboxypeptidase-like regulatory domain-containing protein [Cetobacterium sp.]|uniref:carboxypeptidase-like regulatory domain-containing protein n=1 Tax=unclassified Cetobacterium TaxID=2630983 RepID=UPI00163B7E53|nr:carboxypeptidase-like regulatory domain-containing protein [Cetobacterium sp. 2A]MBC2856276.1 carboxypeptidase regulatory-like domain-containing protein [Cetobacterium sp. 2A]
MKQFVFFLLIISLFHLSKDISISSSESPIKISGIVKSKDVSLGNTQVSFINSENEIFSTQADFAGRFSIYLPKTKYRIVAEKFGYRLENPNKMMQNFLKDGNEKSLVIEMIKFPSVVEGRILNQDGEPIPKASVKIKAGENTIDIQANEFGIFNSETPSGLVSIFATKSGYFGNGVAVLLEEEILRNNITIMLQKKLHSISGVVSDGVEAMQDLEILLIDRNSNFILQKTKTNNIGFYELLDIPSQKNVLLKIKGTDKNEDFISQSIKVDSNIKNYNIFLVK